MSIKSSVMTGLAVALALSSSQVLANNLPSNNANTVNTVNTTNTDFSNTTNNFDMYADNLTDYKINVSGGIGLGPVVFAAIEVRKNFASFLNNRGRLFYSLGLLDHQFLSYGVNYPAITASLGAKYKITPKFDVVSYLQYTPGFMFSFLGSDDDKTTPVKNETSLLFNGYLYLGGMYNNTFSFGVKLSIFASLEFGYQF